MVYKIKNNFKRKTIQDKIDTTAMVIKCMTGNDTYKEPDPSLEVLGNALTALQNAAQVASQGGTTNTAIMYAREDELDDLFTLEVAYVQNKSGGNKEKILDAGMEVVDGERTPPALPGIPEQVTAASSGYPGEVLVKWKRVGNAKSYIVEKSADGINGWENCGTCSKTNMAIDGFTTLTYMWFRVIAVGAAGNSPVSEAAKALVV